MIIFSFYHPDFIFDYPDFALTIQDFSSRIFLNINILLARFSFDCPYLLNVEIYIWLSRFSSECPDFSFTLQISSCCPDLFQYCPNFLLSSRFFVDWLDFNDHSDYFLMAENFYRLSRILFCYCLNFLLSFKIYFANWLGFLDNEKYFLTVQIFDWCLFFIFYFIVQIFRRLSRWWTRTLIDGSVFFNTVQIFFCSPNFVKPGQIFLIIYYLNWLFTSLDSQFLSWAIQIFFWRQIFLDVDIFNRLSSFSFVIQVFYKFLRFS